jgi:DNA-binding NarL/FixJ family response regulator
MKTKPRTILLVEDEFLACLHLKTVLANRGYEVVGPASSGQEAIDLAARFRPELVLMDIRIAGNIDGIAAASRILELYAVPVIFMSGYQDRDLREKALALKPLAYLVKPVMIRDIESAIEKIIEGSD